MCEHCEVSDLHLVLGDTTIVVTQKCIICRKEARIEIENQEGTTILLPRVSVQMGDGYNEEHVVVIEKK